MNTYYNDTHRKVILENKSLSLQEASDFFLALSDHIESYIGFMDSYDDVIIFRWMGRNKWLLDHPMVPNTLHRQRYATKDQCIVFISKIYQEYNLYSFEGFEDVPVVEFTLEEMLQFKKEDEILLREEDPYLENNPAQPIVKKQITPKKTKEKSSISMGEQLGVNNRPTPTPTKSKVTSKTQKTSTADDDGFFSI